MNSEEFYMRMIHMNVHPSLFKKIIVVHEETTSKRQELEFPSNIETTITDRDMLLIQIDDALDLWGRRSFYAADQCVKRNGGFGMTTETNAARLQEVVR